MTGAELVAALRDAEAGCCAAVGDPPAIQAAETALREAGVPTVRLSAEILARLPDAVALASAELDTLRLAPPEEGVPRITANREAIRAELEAALAAWVAEVSGSPGPLAVRDLELAVAERLDLICLAELGRPVVLLVPGRRQGRLVRLHAGGSRPGEPLPAALCARVFELGDRVH